jgi:hypothetical protein
VGVFAYAFETKSWNGDIDVYAKAADGSFTHSEIEGDEKSSNYGKTTEYRVWEGENYHGIYHTNDTKARTTRYWQVLGEYPGQTLTQDAEVIPGALMGMANPHGVYEGQPARISTFTTATTPFVKFITSDDCERAVFEKNDAVAGIPCKKYVYDNGYSINSYWVLDNGFCLKYDSDSEYAMTDFYLSEAETTAPTYDYVIGKYYRGRDVYSAPVPLAQMQPLTHMHLGGWAAASQTWVIPWTAGGINYMTMWYEFRNGARILHTYDVNLDMTAFTDAQRIAYFAQVKAIPDMAVKTDVDTDSQTFRDALLPALRQTFPDYTEEQIQERYRQMLANYDANRLVEFKGNNQTEHPSLTFGDSYYYIDYDFQLMTLNSNPFSCLLKISWVRVTIV